MLLFSLIMMRDILTNYRLIIQGKSPDSESDCEPLMSSSSTTWYGTSGEITIFKQDSSDPESEGDDLRTMGQPLNSQFGINSKRKLFPANLTPHDNVYERLQVNYPNKFDGVLYSGGDLLTENKGAMTSGSRETFHEFSEKKKSTHSSLVTIFSIWNTTMGSSLLAMAWGIQKSGLFSGILINVFVAAICLYTAYVLLSVNQKHGIVEQHFEVPDLCRLLIGKWAETLAKTFSLLVLIGADIVYWVLMSNFLYNAVYFLYAMFTNNMDDVAPSSLAICSKEIILNISNSQGISEFIEGESTFNKIWDLYSTVPVILAIIMFPFLNFKSPTFFTKFNSLGTVSVGYLILFTLVKCLSWGVHIPNWMEEFNFKPTFFALSGMLSLSYFIHNIIISIMRHNKQQNNNGRDLIIAFCLITSTYLFIGVSFYISFPLAKSCIEDNILNNFSRRDPMTIIARILLLFQVFTVFPLISFMLRSDILTNLNTIFKNQGFNEFSYRRVIVINILVVIVCILFACFLPKIGTLIRYTGALSGMVYLFLLPNLLKMASLKKEGVLTAPRMMVHIILILIGVVNLIFQFFISEQ